ncbi:SPRY domain-containing SOCS box protein 3 [Petromyzon marinus]|uniref:SPRY domain-containing SOCS box protein 3 n=1 Tax=Petromyzon marinus TaxID=7757 RepID=UPI003F70F806
MARKVPLLPPPASAVKKAMRVCGLVAFSLLMLVMRMLALLLVWVQDMTSQHERVLERQGGAATQAELEEESGAVAVAAAPGSSPARSPSESEPCSSVLQSFASDLDTQDSDSDSEFPSIPSAVPVTGESYCDCLGRVEPPARFPGARSSKRARDCRCGEDDDLFDWVWDDVHKSAAVALGCEKREVNFHMDYSCGTAAVRGSRELCEGQHFWEIKMTSPVYGTDMMVGVGTEQVNLDRYRHMFCSLLGKDDESWGLSYTGLLYHKGDKMHFSTRFGQGSILGVHLDTWHGTLTFYKNRKCLGVAARGLQNKRLFPMVCSTAARSSMKVIRCRSAPTSLQFLCCLRLRQLIPAHSDALQVLPLPPGLRLFLRNNLGWILSLCTHGARGADDGSGGGGEDGGGGGDDDDGGGVGDAAGVALGDQTRAVQRKKCRLN